MKYDIKKDGSIIIKFESVDEFRNACNIKNIEIEDCIATMNTRIDFKSEITTYNGVTYESEREMCNSLGVDYDLYKSRRRKGWTVDDALTTRAYDKRKAIKMNYKGESVTFEGVTYPSRNALCRAYNVNSLTFLQRKKRGWTLEECVYGKKNKGSK